MNWWYGMVWYYTMRKIKRNIHVDADADADADEGGEFNSLKHLFVRKENQILNMGNEKGKLRVYGRFYYSYKYDYDYE